MRDLTEMTHAHLVDELRLLRTQVAQLEASYKPRSYPRRRNTPPLPMRRRAKLQALTFDNLADAVIVADISGRILQINPAARRIFGSTFNTRSVGEWQSITTLFLPDKITPFPFEQLPLMRCLYGEEVKDVEIFARWDDLPDGHWIIASARPLVGPDGTQYGGMVVCRDITAHKQAEEALRASETALREHESQLRLANEAANIGTWRQDINTGSIHFDARGRAHFGLDANQVMAADVLARIHPDDRARHAQAMAAAGSPTSDGRYSLEYRVVHGDGSLYWLAIQARAYFEGDGDARHMVLSIGTSQDITARKQGEEALQRSTERLRTLRMIDQAILEGQSPAQVAAIVVAHLRRLLPCQRATVLMYEADDGTMQILAASSETPAPLPADGLIELDTTDLAALARQPLPWFVSDTLAEPRLAHRTEVLSQLGVRSMLNVPLVTQQTLLGTLILSAPNINAFTANHLQIAFEVVDQLVIAIHNAQLIAQLKRERSDLARRVADRTADLSTANQELARSAQRKDEFLANMSHELRTPLNAILGRSELLRTEIYGPLNEKQQQGMVAIEESGQHLLSLISDILDLSKIEADHVVLEPNTVLVNDVCRAALRMVAQVAVQKQLRLLSSIDGQVETMIADERRLKQILVNLLANAVKFTPDGGEVGLSVQGYPEDERVTFTIWDTGIGIAIEDQTRLFQPFVQISSSLSRQYGGTGLGLALVMRLARLHGGSVTMESSPGAGSRFSVTLPWVSTPRHAPAIEADDPDASLVMIPKVLVIEDSPTTADQLRHDLDGIAAQVAMHARAAGAVEQAVAFRPDAILLSLLLPDHAGLDVLRMLKADPRVAKTPVLVMSDDNSINAHQLGAAGTLSLPVGRPELLAMLRRWRLPPDTTPPLIIANAGSAAGSQPLILLVDDNQANIDVLMDYLPMAGYRLAIARNGGEAITRAEELQPALILMDIQMPVIDGLEAIRRIRAAGMRQTPIIALTALVMRGDRERCLAIGANAYMPKPVSMRTLLGVIAEQLDRRG